MIATASAVHFAGAKPVPVGISEEDYLIDPKKIVKKITKKTKGIIVTQLNGRVAKMHEIKKIATKYNLSIKNNNAITISKIVLLDSLGEGSETTVTVNPKSNFFSQ